MGLEEEDIPDLIAYAKKDLSALTNPRNATDEDYEAMIRESF